MIEKHYLRLTLSRSLLKTLVERAVSQGRSVIEITDRSGVEQIKPALDAEGFFPAGDGVVKVCCPGVFRRHEACQRVTELIEASGIRSADLLETLHDPSVSPLVSEHLFWPLKVIGCDIPSYLVSIQSEWARNLFDYKLASENLLGADQKYALNQDYVYYRAHRPKWRPLPGRVLWHVTGLNPSGGAGAVRACSTLMEFHEGPATDLFKTLKRFGVYEWNDVLKTANNDPQGTVSAFKFGDSELFAARVPYKSVKSILESEGFRNKLQSPVTLTERAFLGIYSIGTHRQIPE